MQMASIFASSLVAWTKDGCKFGISEPFHRHHTSRPHGHVLIRVALRMTRFRGTRLWNSFNQQDNRVTMLGRVPHDLLTIC
jgi:hypothetical protein